MTALALCLLAVTDASFSGFRAYAGRDGRVQKRRSKIDAGQRGAAAGVVALAVLAPLLLLIVGTDEVTYPDMVAAGRRMLWVNASYATVIAAGFAAYFSPVLELRALATVLVLGPGTLVRPAVVVGGAFAAAWGQSPLIWLAAALAAGVMLAVEPAMGRHYAKTYDFRQIGGQSTR